MSKKLIDKSLTRVLFNNIPTFNFVNIPMWFLKLLLKNNNVTMDTLVKIMKPIDKQFFLL